MNIPSSSNIPINRINFTSGSQNFNQKAHSATVNSPVCGTNVEERNNLQQQQCPPSILGDAAKYLPNLQPDDPYTTNIFLIRHNYSNFLGFYQLLKVSLQFSNLQLDEDYEMTLNYIYCTMKAKGVGKNLLLARGQGKTQREARNNTSEKALEMLLQKCFTLQVHKKASGDGEVSLSGIDGNFGSDFEKISDDNVGAKLLKMMGWSGGALGKTGEGITEPVQTSTVIGRQGLGVQNEAGVTPQFVNKVRYLIKKFRFSEDTSDLIFSSDLSAEQRKQIHIIVSQMGKNKMKTTAIGKGRHRYLVVKKKFDGLDLVKMVLAQGGVTDKYELCRPGTLTMDDLSKDEIC